MENIAIGQRVGWNVRLDVIDKHIVHTHQLMVEEYERNRFSDAYFDLLEKRGISYLEYLKLFDQKIKEEDFLDYLTFQFLGIDSEYGYYNENQYIYGRKDYTNQYEPTEKDYFKLLKTFPKVTENLYKTQNVTAIPIQRMWEHTYINGASGSGKSTLMKHLIHRLSKTKDSIILIDPQGKLANETKAFAHLDKERLVYLKPKLKDGFTPTINFLEKQVHTNTNALALRLARMISVLSSNGELSTPMIALLRPCLTILIDQEDTSLSDLKRFLMKGENEDLIQLGLNYPDEDFQASLKRINTGYFNRTRDAVFSKLDMVLLDEVLKALTTGKSTIDLKQCMEQGKIVVVDLGGLESDTIQTFGRLLVAMILNVALERDPSKIDQFKRSYLFIDEMHNFLSPDLIKILDEARQKKLHLVMAHQRIGQLKAHIQSNMEENYIDSIIGNTAIKIVGHNDSPDTLNVLSTKLGMDKEKLTSIPNYEFILRVRGKQDEHFRSSNEINDDRFYLSEIEVQERDEYMIQHYYKSIERQTSQMKKIETKTATISKTNSIIQLDEDDF